VILNLLDFTLAITKRGVHLSFATKTETKQKKTKD